MRGNFDDCIFFFSPPPPPLLQMSADLQTGRGRGREFQRGTFFCAKSQLVSVVGMKGENLKESDGRTHEKSLRKEPRINVRWRKKRNRSPWKFKIMEEELLSLNRTVVQDSRTFPVTFLLLSPPQFA